MNKEELEESNRSKYGEKSEDLISRSYDRNAIYGDVYCCTSAERYLDRFSREGSSKGLNKIDLIKTEDYIKRAIEKSGEPELEIRDIDLVRVEKITKDIKFKDKEGVVRKIAMEAIDALVRYMSIRDTGLLLKALAIVEEMHRFVDKKKKNEKVEE